MKTSDWNFSRAATLHLFNMANRGEKLQQLHCYHPFSDSRDTYLTKNHHENYSPKMVPTNPSGSWTIILSMSGLSIWYIITITFFSNGSGDFSWHKAHWSGVAMVIFHSMPLVFWFLLSRRRNFDLIVINVLDFLYVISVHICCCIVASLILNPFMCFESWCAIYWTVLLVG